MEAQPGRGAARVGRSATVMGAATALSRALGFVRVLVVAAVLGTTDLGNTFQGSNLVSNVLFELLAAGALSAVLVPQFVRLFADEREDAVERLAGGLLGVALVGLGVVALVGVVASPVIARFLTAGVEGSPDALDQQRELTTFLLRFFIPQVMLYGVGAVATALLHARRRFTVTATAPIANTVVIVAGMGTFAALRGGASPSLSLAGWERLTLAVAGTLGVAGFVGFLVIGLLRQGIRLRPRWPRNDPLVWSTIRHAAWAGFQNASVGLLLGAALIVGMAVPGGVVAYYVAYTFFLVPYAVLGQSIHDVILPELSRDAAEGDLEGFRRDLGWGLDAMSLLVVPAAAAYMALGHPIMVAVAFGETTSLGVDMTAAALSMLALGLFPYSAFLLLTRASYALGDSRTPTLVSIGSALVGVGGMVALAPRFGPEGRLAIMGAGVAASYGIAALVLGLRLSTRVGGSLVPRALWRAVPTSAVLGGAGWGVWRLVDPTGRLVQLGLLAVIGVLGAMTYTAMLHPPSLGRLGRRPGLEGAG